MTTQVLEILSEEMLQRQPPCEIVEEPDKDCNRPSVARVSTVCDVHGAGRPFFICTRCLDELKRGVIVCTYCYDEGNGYREIRWAGCL